MPHREIGGCSVAQSCPTLCHPLECGPLGSSVPGILQARTPEWVAISFSNAWKWKVKVKSLSHFQLFATPWTAAYQAPTSMGFSRQEYWSGLPLPSPTSFNKGSNERNWFNDFILKFKQKARTEWWCRSDKKSRVTMPMEDNSGLCQTSCYICSWMFWRSLMIFLGDRKNSGFSSLKSCI